MNQLKFLLKVRYGQNIYKKHILNSSKFNVISTFIFKYMLKKNFFYQAHVTAAIENATPITTVTKSIDAINAGKKILLLSYYIIYRLEVMRG